MFLRRGRRIPLPTGYATHCSRCPLARRHRKLRRLAFSLAPLALALLAIEGAARLIWRAPEADRGAALVPHPTRMWGLGAGRILAYGAAHTVDSSGLRAVAARGAPLRVLTLGDSSIYGHGLADEDTLHAELAAALAGRGIDADVLCGGIPGYSTEQTLRLMDEVGWDLDPDLLVVGSLWSDSNFDQFVDREWLAALDAPTMQLDLRLRRYSVAWRWLRERGGGGGGAFLPVGWIRAPEPVQEGRRRVPLADYAANLDRLLMEGAERGVGAIALAPCNRIRLNDLYTRLVWDPYFEALEAVADHRGVPLVDAGEALRDALLTTDAAFLDEMHPTAAANRVYADALAAALAGAGWPADPLLADPSAGAFDGRLDEYRPW